MSIHEPTIQLKLTLKELAFFKAIADETLIRLEDVLVSNPKLEEAIALRHTTIISLAKLDCAIDGLEV